MTMRELIAHAWHWAGLMKKHDRRDTECEFAMMIPNQYQNTETFLDFGQDHFQYSWNRPETESAESNSRPKSPEQDLSNTDSQDFCELEEAPLMKDHNSHDHTKLDKEAAANYDQCIYRVHVVVMSGGSVCRRLVIAPRKSQSNHSQTTATATVELLITPIFIQGQNHCTLLVAEVNNGVTNAYHIDSSGSIRGGLRRRAYKQQSLDAVNQGLEALGLADDIDVTDIYTGCQAWVDDTQCAFWSAATAEKIIELATNGDNLQKSLQEIIALLAKSPPVIDEMRQRHNSNENTSEKHLPKISWIRTFITIFFIGLPILITALFNGRLSSRPRIKIANPTPYSHTGAEYLGPENGLAEQFSPSPAQTLHLPPHGRTGSGTHPNPVRP